MKRDEADCDEVIGQIIKALDQTFITPFDREDIHTLATALDDIMDNMEETAHRFEAFRIDKPTPTAVSLARIIRDCCLHLEKAFESAAHHERRRGHSGPSARDRPAGERGRQHLPR